MFKRFIAALISAVMAVLMLPVTSFAATTYVYATPSGWAQAWENLKPNELMSVSLDDKVFQKGDHSLKIESWGGILANHYLRISTTVQIEPGKTYVYGGYVKAEDVQKGYTMIEWANKNDFFAYEKTFNWRRFENTYVNSSETKTSLSFSIVFDGGGGTIWFDSLYFHEADEDGNPIGPNLFINGTFDTGVSSSSAATGNAYVAEGTASGFDASLEALYYQTMQKEEFPVSDMESILGAMKTISVKRTENEIVIDGKNDDWGDSYTPLRLPVTSGQYQIYDTSASRDVTAEYKYAFDDEYFYFIAEVEDPVHVADTTSAAFWKNDSLQLGVSTDGETFGLGIGLSYDPQENISYKYCSQLTTEQISEIKFQGTREGMITTYEMAFPWHLKFPDGRPDDFLFTYIINNADAKDSREYCVEVSKGISEGKYNSEFPRLLLNDNDWYSWASPSASEVTVGSEITYTYTIVNKSSERSFDITINGEKRTVTVPADTVKNVFYKDSCGNEPGTFEYVSSLSCEGVTKDYNYTYSVVPTLSFFDGVFDEYDTWLKTLEQLLNRCESKGISTDYETMTYSVMKEFYPYTKEDIQKNKLVRAAANIKNMRQLYEETKADLEAYLAGTKTSPVVPRYVTSDVTIEGRQLYANVDVNGTIERRPVYFSGYGHFLSPEEIEVFQESYGANIAQLKIGVAEVLRESTTGYGFEVNPQGLDSLKAQLDAAEKSNVSVILLIEHHNYPTWLTKKYTDMAVSESAGGYFMRYNIDHEVTRAAMETYLTEVCNLAKDYTCIQSFTVGNEDMYRTNRISFYKPYYQLYLTELYKADINVLNARYGTSYKSFSEIPMPTNFEANQYCYDWRNFNNKVFNDYHAWIAAFIKERIPDAKFQTKWVVDLHVNESYMGHTRSFFMSNGMDFEKFGEWANLNGNDSYLLNDSRPGLHPLDVMMTLDAQIASNNAPVVNSEVHLGAQADDPMDPRFAQNVRAGTWQQAVHNTASMAHWMLGMRSWEYNYYSHKVDLAHKLNTTNLDLMRLAYELQALGNKQGELAVYYSQTSRVYDENYMSNAFEAYKAAATTGKKTDILVDSHPESLSKYKVLVLPNTKAVPAAMLSEIKKFSDNGGTVIMIGEESLRYNEYNEPHDAAIVDAIAQKAVIIPIVNGFADSQAVSDAIDNAVNAAGYTAIDLIDVSTEEKVKDTEYIHVDYNGKTLINLCLWEVPADLENTRTVKIRINGVDYNGEIKDLLSGKALDTQFEIAPITPMLLEISK